MSNYEYNWVEALDQRQYCTDLLNHLDIEEPRDKEAVERPQVGKIRQGIRARIDALTQDIEGFKNRNNEILEARELLQEVKRCIEIRLMWVTKDALWNWDDRIEKKEEALMIVNKYLEMHDVVEGIGLEIVQAACESLKQHCE